jgi:DNA-binding SARP family transcriptional activator
MRYLFARALDEGIERDYVTGLIRKLGLTPPVSGESATSACYLEEWPYPVKIYTLGRFEIFRNDEPLHFSGKEQKKPLELLKALISFGGRDVPEERLTDSLWPDADGDQARKSFETTLGRLRRLLGGEDVITCRARQLTINPHHCRVDSLVLAALFDRIPQTPNEQVVPLCEKAVDLYKGAFLPCDIGMQWAVTCRETLKNRLLRAIGTAGRHYEQTGEWEKGADYFSKGVETDTLAEEFYRRLMSCQRSLGNHADAVKTYNRCRRLLHAELGISPSPETTAVYSSIIQK